MNTRRIPFQFSTTDPLARQRELERRFGLQPTFPKMYVDVNNPLSMGTTPSEVSSPRLQHRVPIFAEGFDQPIHSSSVDSMASVPENKKPNVRVIPIEIEGADRSPRHRTYSGPAGTVKDRCDSLTSERNGIPPFKRFNFEDLTKPSKPKLNVEPKIFNIPIQVEGVNKVSRGPQSSENKADAIQKTKTSVSSSNSCTQSKAASKEKSPNKSEVPSEPTENKVYQPKNTVEILLKKIDAVLNEFKTYETEVIEFTGTSKDKQYRYLDEMLTRCMLRLDDIDTFGNEEIRLARKSAVKKIQASIDLLESKANVEQVASTEASEQQLVPGEKTDNEVEMQDTLDDNVSAEGIDSSEINQIVCDNKDQSKVYDNHMNDGEAKTGSKVESIKTEEKSNNATDVEMCEMPQHKVTVENSSSCESTNVDGSFESKVEDTKQGEESSASPLQQNNMPEIEMTEEMSSDKISSVNNTQSCELLGFANNCAEQNSISNETVSNDVEMLDENDRMSNVVEGKESLNKLAESECHLTKSNEISEVEMEEIGNISSKESGDTKISNPKSDCSEEKIGNVTSNASSEEAEISSGVHKTVNDCLTDRSGLGNISETSQS